MHLYEGFAELSHVKLDAPAMRIHRKSEFWKVNIPVNGAACNFIFEALDSERRALLAEESSALEHDSPITKR